MEGSQRSLRRHGFYRRGRSVFSDGARSDGVHVQTVSPNFFKLLGVSTYRGRVITAAPQSADTQGELPVVISYRLWQNWFGADTGVLGRGVFLDSFPRTIIGVMPPGFSFGRRDVDVWPSMTLDPVPARNKVTGNLNAVGLLRPEVTLAQAQRCASPRTLLAHHERCKNSGTRTPIIPGNARSRGSRILAVFDDKTVLFTPRYGRKRYPTPWTVKK